MLYAGDDRPSERLEDGLAHLGNLGGELVAVQPVLLSTVVADQDGMYKPVSRFIFKRPKQPVPSS